MFASTYAWMSHMARFHSEMEWVCRKCAKDPDSGASGISILAFKEPTQLKQHLSASHPPVHPAELDLIVGASRSIIGIQKVECPLRRPGLVTLEREDGEGTSRGSPPLVPSSQEIGLVQLEKDEHIATHIHGFALHSFPLPDEVALESSGVS